MVSTGSPWEDKVGYSRAVRIGNIVEVTGTVADNAGALVGGDDPYAQTVYCLQKIEAALKELDASLADVIRTRIYVRDITQWAAIGAAHAEFFAETRPCTSMIEISRLIGDEYLVEIEASAVVVG